jgi:hypothetical protein
VPYKSGRSTNPILSILMKNKGSEVCTIIAYTTRVSVCPVEEKFFPD